MDEDQILQSIIADPDVVDPSIDVSKLRQTTKTNPMLLAKVPEFFGLEFDPSKESYIEDLYSIYGGGLPTIDVAPEVVDTTTSVVDTTPVIDTGGSGGGGIGPAIGGVDLISDTTPDTTIRDQLIDEGIQAAEDDKGDMMLDEGVPVGEAYAPIDTLSLDQGVPVGEAYAPIDTVDYSELDDLEADLGAQPTELGSRINQAFENVKNQGVGAVESFKDSLVELGGKVREGFDNIVDFGGTAIDFGETLKTGALNYLGKNIFGPVGAVLGTALQALPPRDPRETALEELYDVKDGSIQSGLMAGYNPVSGNPLDPNYGLQEAYEDRIDTIENTLTDKYNMTDAEIADVKAGSYTGDVDSDLLNRLNLLEEAKEKEKDILDLFSGDVDERDQMLEDLSKDSLQSKIDAGIAAADEEPGPSGDGPQGVDAGTADIQDYADIYEPPAAPTYSGQGDQGGGGGANIGGGQQTSSGGPGGFSSGSGGWGWAKGGIVSLKNAKR